MTRSRAWIFWCCCLVLAGCAGIARSPVPEEHHLAATVLDGGIYRYWGDEPLTLADNLSQEELEAEYPGFVHKEHTYLALSGGGAYGAYGAGVLKGWSELETRPQFTLVTGISTGALIAPFAFLGPEYDDELELLRLKVSDDDQRVRDLANADPLVELGE